MDHNLSYGCNITSSFSHTLSEWIGRVKKLELVWEHYFGSFSLSLVRIYTSKILFAYAMSAKKKKKKDFLHY